jgi:hypothetical protein
MLKGLLRYQCRAAKRVGRQERRTGKNCPHPKLGRGLGIFGDDVLAAGLAVPGFQAAEPALFTALPIFDSLKT